MTRKLINHGTEKHQILIPEKTPEEVDATRCHFETRWRNRELVRTDALMMIPDYPNTSRLMSYRQDLRDYPATENFPNGERPML